MPLTQGYYYDTNSRWRIKYDVTSEVGHERIEGKYRQQEHKYTSLITNR